MLLLLLLQGHRVHHKGRQTCQAYRDKRALTREDSLQPLVRQQTFTPLSRVLSNTYPRQNQDLTPMAPGC